MTAMKLNDMLDEVIKQHIAEGKDTREFFQPGGLLKQFTKALAERCLREGEMNHHLGYGKDERIGKSNENRRNGSSKKTCRERPGQDIVGHTT